MVSPCHESIVLINLAGVAAAKDDAADLSSTPKVADEAAQKTGTDAAAAER
jgi:hypothetical protein